MLVVVFLLWLCLKLRLLLCMWGAFVFSRRLQEFCKKFSILTLTFMIVQSILCQHLRATMAGILTMYCNFINYNVNHIITSTRRFLPKQTCTWNIHYQRYNFEHMSASSYHNFLSKCKAADTFKF